MEKHLFNMNLGEALRQMRQDFEMTQKQMAGIADLCRAYYGGLGRGKNSMSVYTLTRILNKMEISVESFFLIMSVGLDFNLTEQPWINNLRIEEMENRMRVRSREVH